jgi:hypothetical protein
MAGVPSELNIVIAQMSVAVAGFGGLASGLGQTETGDDAQVDAMRLGVMLSSSLSAAVLGLAPRVLIGMGLLEPTAVRLSAILGLAAMFAYAPLSILRAFQIRGARGFSKGGTAANAVCSIVAFSSFAVSSLGLPGGRPEGAYLLGLFGLLCSSIIMFSRVMASMLRPHKPGGG